MLTCFTARRSSGHIPVSLVTPDSLKSWRGTNAALSGQLDHLVFTARPGETAILRSASGAIEHVLFGVNAPVKFYDLAGLPAALVKAAPVSILANSSFDLTGDIADRTNAYAGWALGCLQLSKDKKPVTTPTLAVEMDEAYQAAESHINAITLLRDLVNKPSNLLGPDELEQAALDMARGVGAENINVIFDEDLNAQNFPLVYTVGMASTRRPRLIEFTIGNPRHPRVAIVGKGVCFDTGGLDIKPADGMRLMKKDMGGAAHALALAKLVGDAKLPVHLHVVIPAVENSIDGNAFRPGDVYPSRKGLTVEIGNTDAEGRLILADAMAYALESKPDLLINFATLTGAARAAMGTEVMPIFANKDSTAQALQKVGLSIDDPMWHLPLWGPYREDLDSDVADIGSVGGKAGMITAALFLQAFVGAEQDWVHYDIYSWRDAAKPGRPKGGYETGLRAVFTYLQQRYAHKA